MGKALLGFLIGVALTSVAFVLLTGDPAAAVAEQTSAMVPPAQANPGPGTGAPENDAPRTAAVMPEYRSAGTASQLPEDLTRFALRDEWTSDEAINLLSAWTDEELKALESRAEEMTQPSQDMQDAGKVMSLARSELARRELVSHWADAPPPDLPIELPPEFSWLSRNPVTLHEQLQREPVDSAWSLQTEANIRNFLTSRPEIMGTYGVPTITCRTSWCQIALVVHGMDDPGQRAGSGVNEGRGKLSVDISTAIRPIYDQPWASQLNRAQEYRDLNFQPGAATILVHIRRTQN